MTSEEILRYWNLIASMAPIFWDQLTKAVPQYWNLIIFLIPLGAVGFWRWSVWLIKKFIALNYKSPVKYPREGTLTVVTPVYNEDPVIFEKALHSWIRHGQADEIIAVIDYADKKCIAVFERFADIYPEVAKLIITKKPGKRPALADGVKAASSEFVALVDSDTIWSGPLKEKALSVFADPEVGGVSPRQDVYQPDTLARRLFQIHLANRYFNDLPFQAAAGDALTCLSGRTAIYRRSAIIDLIDKMANEKFWGAPVISGDDKTLTRLVQGAGWKAKYIHDEVVYAPGFPKMSSFLRQLVRWNRNSWRSDLQTLFSGWVWRKNKLLALHMIDRFFQPFTLLLGPIYLVIALSFGYWKTALIIFVWWMISRPIKIFGHLRRHPRDIFIMPEYVFFTFVTAVIKIYALFTFARQGWITRWDTSRLKSFSFLRQVPAYVLSISVIIGYFSVVSFYHYQTLSASALKSAQKKELRAIASIISTEPRLVSAAELAQKRTAIMDWKKTYSYGYYVIKPGDTLLSLRDKFNLTSISSMTYENNVSIANANSISIGQKISIPIPELQRPLNADTLLASQFGRRPPLIFFDKTLNAIRVSNSGSVVTLAQIRQSLGGNKAYLEETAPGEWILRANLYIGKNATLVLDKKEVQYLKLKSDANGHIWVRSQNGNILISNTKVTSWDETKQAPDLEYLSGRSYITAKGSGRLDVVNSEIAYLGYVGLPKRGGPFGGSYGLSWKITSGKFNDNLLTGSVIGSSIHDNYFGMYTFGATGLVIKNNEVFDNVQYGIDPHDDSNNLLIANNRVRDNGNHGIILSKRCFNNEISGNISYDNKLHGIMLDRSSNNNFVENNTVYGNIDGIAVYASNYNFIADNNIYSNKQGIRFNQKSSFNYIEKNQILNNSASGIHIYGEASGNLAVENSISGNALGVSIQNASGNALYASLRPSDNKKDGHVTVDKTANEIK